MDWRGFWAFNLQRSKQKHKNRNNTSLAFFLHIDQAQYLTLRSKGRTHGVDNRPCLAAATLSRLLFLTMYIASSAKCSNSALVFESVG